MAHSPDCNLLTEEENTLISDLVKKGTADAVMAIKRSAMLEPNREPDIALSCGTSVLLSIFAKGHSDLTYPDGSNPALDAAVFVLNEGFKHCGIPFVVVRITNSES